MSFIGILKNIGRVALGIERVAASTGLGHAFIPGFAVLDRIFQAIPGSIAIIEAQNPGDKQGAQKLPLVIEDFEAGLALTREILASQGKTLTYDQGELQVAIAAQVSAFNAMARVKKSFKITDTPPVP